MSRILLVDDDPGVRDAYRRTLEKAGHQVTVAAGGEEGIVKLRAEKSEVILADIVMPGMNGLEFLRAVRGHDLDVPVVLMTGVPGMEQAVKALDYGAYKFLNKPVERDELLATIESAAQLHAFTRIKRDAEQTGTNQAPLGDRASLESRFERAIKGMWMAFQPIVSWDEKNVLGYEALLRTDEMSLIRPDHFLDTAEKLGRSRELARAARASAASRIPAAPPDAQIFVNVHAADLMDDELYDKSSPLCAFSKRVVVEITERASLDGVTDLQARVKALRAVGYRIAIDDLGAGYAGLATLPLIEPEVVKIDMSLVRGIHKSPVQRRVMGALVNLCRDMKLITVAEGIETVEERDVVIELGCRIFQGFLFARPEREFKFPTF